MKTSSRILGLLSVLLTGATLASGQAVSSPAKRQQALERAKALVAPREVVPIEVNPFYPAAFAETVAGMRRPAGGTTTQQTVSDATTTPVAPTGPRTDRDLLVAMAKTLTPSGSFVIGGSPLLTFGQKRVKAGGTLTITFEGNQYTVEVVSISPPNFTLRLNSEEFTRTIK
jgi:hypothetical protein